MCNQLKADIIQAQGSNYYNNYKYISFKLISIFSVATDRILSFTIKLLTFGPSLNSFYILYDPYLNKISLNYRSWVVLNIVQGSSFGASNPWPDNSGFEFIIAILSLIIKLKLLQVPGFSNPLYSFHSSTITQFYSEALIFYQ